MSKNLILILIGLMLTFSVTDADAQKRKKKKANVETTEWKYDIEPEGLGTQNNKIVKVWSYSKKIDIAKFQATKNAIHGIIFKGVAGNRDKRFTPVLALVPDFETRAKFQPFFDEFFADGGDYRMYAEATDISDSIVKIDRKMYKVGVIINVRYDALRKMLEDRGIVKKLNHGF